MSVLSDRDILVRLMKGDLVVSPIDDPDTQIQPCSVDLRLDADVVIDAGEFLLASTIERIKLPPDLVGRLNGRSSIGRLGVQVENAGFFDPGFEGTATLELVNFSSRRVTFLRGQRICQMSFETLTSPSARPYGHPSRRSKYLGQTGVTESRLDKEHAHPLTMHEMIEEAERVAADSPNLGGPPTHLNDEPAEALVGITINGREFGVKSDKLLTYETICWMVNLSPDGCPTMTYRTRRKGDEQRSGSLCAGKTVCPEPGMVFNVTYTGNA